MTRNRPTKLEKKVYDMIPKALIIAAVVPIAVSFVAHMVKEQVKECLKLNKE